MSRPTPFVNFTDQRQTTLVGRAREICLNNSYGQKALRILKNNVIGEFGMRLQSHVKRPDGSLDIDVNTAIEAAWMDFSMPDALDTAMQASLQEFQELCLSSIVTDGDFFIQNHGGRQLPLRAEDSGGRFAADTARLIVAVQVSGYGAGV